MPHIHHATFAQKTWEPLCAEAEIRYIDPRWPVEQVLQAIGETQVLLAEAMHGAIVADALRVPWIPIITSPRILRFKWQDWCKSMALPYRPQVLPPVLRAYPRYGRGVKSTSRAAKHWLSSGQPWILCSVEGEGMIVRCLKHILKWEQPFLSQEDVFKEQLQRLENKLNILQAKNG
jgi:succinoglycan biosynthesis protein ExoV